MAEGNRKESQAAQLQAQMRKADLEKKAESRTWLVRMIYLMALLFVITVFELDGVFYGLVAFFAEMLSGVFDSAPTWVASVKGSMQVILVGGFGVATGAARFLARQRT